MPTAAAISKPPLMHSRSEQWLSGRALLRCMVLLACAAPGFAKASPPAAVSLCHPDEAVRFSCPIGRKLVSLCAAGKSGASESLSYRYGAARHIEKTFVASADNGRRFHGTVSPARPGASVSQVWFDLGEVRYLLSACTGGSCAFRAGLAVFQGDRILMNARCDRAGDGDLAWFSSDLVKFGSGAADSASATSLLLIEDVDNDIVRLYGLGPAKAR